MAFDPVPWAIGGGAEHTPEVLRLLAYTATSKGEGVVSPEDMKVTATPTPSGSVRIGTGAAVMLNRYPGGSQQSYAGRAPSSTDVAIPPTSSGSGRSDLIVARITDPDYGGQVPSNRKIGPYFVPERISGVSSGIISARGLNLPYPAVALARIDIPASTGTITPAMITDLRQVANPLSRREVRSWSPGAAQTWNRFDGQYWLFPLMEEPIFAPYWANWFHLQVTISGLLVSGSIRGSTRAEYGWNFSNTSINSQDTGIHRDGAGAERYSMVIASANFLPQDFRDKTHFVRCGTVLTVTPNNTGFLQADQWTTVTVDMEFTERAM